MCSYCRKYAIYIFILAKKQSVAQDCFLTNLLSSYKSRFTKAVMTLPINDSILYTVRITFTCILYLQCTHMIFSIYTSCHSLYITVIRWTHTWPPYNNTGEASEYLFWAFICNCFKLITFTCILPKLMLFTCLFRPQTWTKKGAVYVFQEEWQERSQGGAVGRFCCWALSLSPWWGKDCPGEVLVRHFWLTVLTAVTVIHKEILDSKDELVEQYLGHVFSSLSESVKLHSGAPNCMCCHAVVISRVVTTAGGVHPSQYHQLWKKKTTHIYIYINISI